MSDNLVQIHVAETAGCARYSEPVRLAIPWVMGELQPGRQFRMRRGDGGVFPCQARPLKLWRDGSVKWLLLDALLDSAAGESGTFVLEPAAEPVSQGIAISMRHGAATLEVDTGAALFSIDTGVFRPFASVSCGGGEVSGRGSCLLGAGNGNPAPRVDGYEIEDPGPLHAVLRMRGGFAGDGETPKWAARLHFFAGSAAARIEFTLHNPRAARHPGGLWDLGDAGSFRFRELTFSVPCAGAQSAETVLYPEPEGPAVTSRGGSLSIYQESSGGENWRSPNHRCHTGEVPLKLKGYLVRDGGGKAGEGLRATPSLWSGRDGTGISVAVPRFWQEFPKALAADAGSLLVSLFPREFPEGHELQGGEQKTHTFHLDFATAPGTMPQLWAPLQATLPPELYRRTGVFHDLPTGEGDLVDSFISAGELLEKRELIDEYGWRNFGDLVADHEAVYHQGSDPFISHYNNQYDPCAGAYRKFFATGDPLWGEIAADLARHVLDIDIYHTGEDREEYNGGLFWHTDHYIDAGLSTHRSFSKEHLAARSVCGGGPAAEHCYANGLAIHYLLTGDPAYKDAVLGLADWCLRSLRGPQTVLAALKRGADLVRKWRRTRGAGIGRSRYPLTRGTGNAIAVCLDALEVGGGEQYLLQAQELIEGTVHPEDDIEARNLLNPEIAWSYTVLLASIGKYLLKKAEMNELDDHFDYARRCLLAYADWMVSKEYPYLDKPELLEYPNETWAVQELRKSVVLYYAASHSTSPRRESYLDKARELCSTAVAELRSRESSRYCRPVVVMLQTGWIERRLAAGVCPAPVVTAERALRVRPPGPVTLAGVGRRLVADIVYSLRQTSLQRELAWLRTRLG